MAMTSGSAGVPGSYYALNNTLYECLCVTPFFSVAIAAFSGVAALRWSRSALTSLNDAVRAGILTSVPTACIGAAVPVPVFDLLAFYSHLDSTVYGYSFLIGMLGLFLFGTLSVFGSLMYSIYVLNLRYVHGTVGN